MRQRLGENKHRKCEDITGKTYTSCLVRGNSKHYWAICWYSEQDADWVNYKTREWEAYIRDGQSMSKVRYVRVG